MERQFTSVLTSIEEVAVSSSNRGLHPSARSRARRSWIAIAIALCALASLAIAGPASASGQATITTSVDHLFANPEHYPGCDGGPGVTEYATGTERQHVVELANGTFHVTLGDTLRILEVS